MVSGNNLAGFAQGVVSATGGMPAATNLIGPLVTSASVDAATNSLVNTFQ